MSGPYFEDLEKGRTYKHFPGRTITEADDMWFSCLTLNPNPLHIDAHYAAQTQHGQRLVNGLKEVDSYTQKNTTGVGGNLGARGVFGTTQRGSDIDILILTRWRGSATLPPWRADRG